MGFFCAHTHTQWPGEKGGTAPEQFYYDLDLEFLRRTADAILAIPGWEKSWGASNEVKIAKELGVPIFEPKSPDDLDDVVKWFKKIES